MKKIKWKILIITALICLLPILLGVAMWDSLPDQMAIHFNVNNQADGFASKLVAVVMLPVMMAVVQILCCIINDLGIDKYKGQIKLVTISKWIIPLLTIILQIVTVYYNLGKSIDIRKLVALIIGIIFVVIGCYFPNTVVRKFNGEVVEDKRTIRFMKASMVVLGILSIISIFLSPVSTYVGIFLLIPYSIICVVIGIKI